MSRTRRCAPDVEGRMLSLVVVHDPMADGGLLATMTVLPPEVCVRDQTPITVTGEGPTVARAVGAAECAAWAAMLAAIPDTVVEAAERSEREDASRGQQSLEQHVEPHEWLLSGTVLDLDSGWVDVYVCRRCRTSFEVPAGTTGETLRSYHRGAGSCPGVKRAAKEGSR